MLRTWGKRRSTSYLSFKDLNSVLSLHYHCLLLLALNDLFLVFFLHLFYIRSHFLDLFVFSSCDLLKLLPCRFFFLKLGANILQLLFKLGHSISFRTSAYHQIILRCESLFELPSHLASFCKIIFSIIVWVHSSSWTPFGCFLRWFCDYWLTWLF